MFQSKAVFPVARYGDDQLHSELGWSSFEPTQDNGDGIDMNSQGLNTPHQNLIQTQEEDGVGNPMYWIWENMNGPINWL
jgi:hypothetical protein